MKLSDNIIQEIAQDLDIGMLCYIHKETKEFKSVIDPDEMYDIDEYMQADIDAIEKDFDNYVKIEKMSSREAFKIMEDFADQIQNHAIKGRLFTALSQNKPFRRFKNEVDYAGDVREQWFEFKAARDIEWVKECLENIRE